MNEINALKIGFKSYAIEKPEEISEVAGDYYGTACHQKEVIRIASRYSQHDKNHTFIHEMLHCICMRFDLRELNNDEHTISLLATGIYEAIVDNPGCFLMADV